MKHHILVEGKTYYVREEDFKYFLTEGNIIGVPRSSLMCFSNQEPLKYRRETKFICCFEKFGAWSIGSLIKEGFFQEYKPYRQEELDI